MKKSNRDSNSRKKRWGYKMSIADYDLLGKVVVCGDRGVGKQTIIKRFTGGYFEQDYVLTMGADFHIKTIDIQTAEEIKKFKLQIWDIGGQERFSSVRPMHYRGALSAFLIFDLTNYATFENLPNWIEEIRKNTKEDIPILLIGNKCDLINKRTVNYREIENFAKKFNLHYIEINAKSEKAILNCCTVITYLIMGIDVPDELLSPKVNKLTP